METQTNQPKPKTIRIFNNIDLTKAIKKAKEEPQVKKNVIKVKVKKSKSYKEEPVTVFETDILSIQDGSIFKFIGECHPEIRKFIDENHPETITAKCGQLIIVSKNKVRIVISTLGAYKRKVLITDRKKNVLFNDITDVKFKTTKDGKSYTERVS